MPAQTNVPPPLLQHSAEILGGALVFGGTRVPFQTLIDYLKAGDTLDDFLDDFPSVTREQAFEVLELAQEAIVREIDASPVG
ncbi:MAG: DUF433 domain-containing protein [Chloroflexi bacterium]|nr:DUF433 domain-containing protein [Chloroflexota bacterium]